MVRTATVLLSDMRRSSTTIAITRPVCSRDGSPDALGMAGAGAAGTSAPAAAVGAPSGRTAWTYATWRTV